MNSSTSGWLVLTRNFVAGSHPQNDSFHEVPIQKAVAEGIVDRINAKKGANETPEAFLKRLRAECPNQETWDREYCCIPSDESAAFFTYDLLDPCTDPTLVLPTLDEFLARAAAGFPSLSPPRGEGWGEGSVSFAVPGQPRGQEARSDALTLRRSHAPTLPRSHAPTLYLGVDVARHHDLCVIDVGEKIGSVMFDRLRLELLDQPFTQIEAQLFPLLALPELKRACIDKSGMGEHLSERARERFGWKIEPVNFTLPMKEQLAFALRRDFEDRLLRIPSDDKLRADLRGLKKELTPGGKITFIGETNDSHCDRTWAKALRQHAARHLPSAGAILI